MGYFLNHTEEQVRIPEAASLSYPKKGKAPQSDAFLLILSYQDQNLNDMFMGLPQADNPAEGLTAVINEYGVFAGRQMFEIIMFVNDRLVHDRILILYPAL